MKNKPLYELLSSPQNRFTEELTIGFENDINLITNDVFSAKTMRLMLVEKHAVFKCIRIHSSRPQLLQRRPEICLDFYAICWLALFQTYITFKINTHKCMH